MLLLQISTKPRDGSPRERRRDKKQHNPAPPLPLPPLHKTPKKPADKNLSQCGVFWYRLILLTRRNKIQWEMKKKKKKIPNFGYEEADDDFVFCKKASCLKISRSIISLHQQLIPTFSLKRKQQWFWLGGLIIFLVILVQQ